MRHSLAFSNNLEHWPSSGD